jgi:hypothetical protein
VKGRRIAVEFARVVGFLSDALQDRPGSVRGLSPDELYGLYISWCLMNDTIIESPEALWDGLRAWGIDPASNHLAMKGPVAVDYIIASAPSIL